MEKLEGMVSDIVFKNEENGYTIAYLANENDEITIVGCMPTLSVGESIEVEGKWVNHKTYGSQFEVNSFMPITPSSLEGIYVYLSSGMIHGIGEKMAKRIVDKFGVDTLDIIQNTPERLTEVEGIGMKKVKQISICDFVGYYYRINANSITQEKFSSKRLDVVEACDHIINAINGKKNLEDAAVNLKFRRCFEMYAKIIKAENREIYKQEEINLKLELKKLSKAIISDNKSKMSSKLAALSVKVSIPLTKIIILMISKG